MRLTNSTLSRLRVRKEVGPMHAHSPLTGDANYTTDRGAAPDEAFFHSCYSPLSLKRAGVRMADRRLGSWSRCLVS